MVWGDAREPGVIGARVTSSGSVLDPLGIRITSSSGWLPAVAFDGVNFLVVWFADEFGIRGARVSPSGTLLDPDGIQVCSLAGSWERPAVASGDTISLVVWTDKRDSAKTDIYGARVTRSGVVLDPDGIPIARDSGNQDEPAVAFDGSDYLVVWQDAGRDSTGDIRGARVNPAGVVLDTVRIPISCAASAQANPSVSFGDSVCLVAWDDSGRTAGRRIFCARVSRAGRVLDSNGIKVSVTDTEQTDPAIAFDGTNFLLSWDDLPDASGPRCFCGTHVSQTGIVLDSMGFPVCPLQEDNGQVHALARGDSLCFAVWEDYRYRLGPAIYGARISQTGQVLDRGGFAVSTAFAGYQHAPCAALNHGSYIVAWEQVDEPQRICLSHLAPDGSLLDSAPHTLCPWGSIRHTPAVAAGESCALVVWSDESLAGVAGARVTQSGAVVDSTGLAL